MECEDKYCHNELQDDSLKWDDPANDGKWYTRKIGDKKVCTDCYSLEWY